MQHQLQTSPMNRLTEVSVGWPGHLLPMNTNTYPQGRWTTPSSTLPTPAPAATHRTPAKSIEQKLSDLFWSPVDPELVPEVERKVQERLEQLLGKWSAPAVEAELALTWSPEVGFQHAA